MSYWPRLNPIFSITSVHQRISAIEPLVYLQTNMHWPVSVQDVLSHREFSQDENRFLVRIIDTATIGRIPTRDGVVRVVESSQQWILKPLADGKVKIDWVSRSESTGPITASLINLQ